MSESVVPDDDSVATGFIAASGNTQLFQYIGLLNKQQMLSNTERLVLAGCTVLLTDKRLSRDYLMDLACGYYGAPYPLHDDASQDNVSEKRARKALDDAWEQVTQLSQGLRPTIQEEANEPYDPDEPPQWLQDAMYVAEQLSLWDSLRTDKLLDLLPHDVAQHLTEQLGTSRYGSLEAIGYSLEVLPGSQLSSGLAFGGNKHSVYFAGALARAVMHSINDLDSVPENDPEFTIALAYVQLWTKLLKSYIYGWVQRPSGHQVFLDLIDAPDVVELIKEALKHGIDRGKRANDKGHIPTPAWSGQVNSYAPTIRKTVTADLLKQLAMKLEETKEEHSYGPPL